MGMLRRELGQEEKVFQKNIMLSCFPALPHIWFHSLALPHVFGVLYNRKSKSKRQEDHMSFNQDLDQGMTPCVKLFTTIVVVCLIYQKLSFQKLMVLIKQGQKVVQEQNIVFDKNHLPPQLSSLVITYISVEGIIIGFERSPGVPWSHEKENKKIHEAPCPFCKMMGKGPSFFSSSYIIIGHTGFCFFLVLFIGCWFHHHCH